MSYWHFMIYFDSFKNENTFRTDQNKPQISWEKNQVS